MSQNAKVTIPVIIVGVAGGVMLLEWFFDPPQIAQVSGIFQKLAVLIFSMAMIIGMVGITIKSVKNTQKKGKNWLFDVWLLFVLYAWIIIGLYVGQTSKDYQWLFDNFITALYQSMLALPSLSLFIAIYRGYKFKLNLNSSAITVSFLLVLAAGAPLGELIWPGFTPIRNWVINVPSGAASRALIITMALGIIGISLRTIFGIERTWLGILRLPELAHADEVKKKGGP